MTKWVTIALAVLGLVVAAWVTLTSGQRQAGQAPVQAPPFNPFENGIAASGVVEAASRNIELGPPQAALVTAVLVQVGDRVEKGQVLFGLDTRPLEARLVQQRAAVTVARMELARLEAMPRAEDIPVLQARVAAAGADQRKAKEDYEKTRQTFDAGAATPRELSQAKNVLDGAEATLAGERARLAEAEAGAWGPDIRVARAKVGQAEADVEALRLQIERMSVRSPIGGTVLKRSVEPGEFAAEGPAKPLMVVGDITALRVRAHVDEEDLPRLRDGAKAVARIRGEAQIEVPLTMIRIEPLAEPKSQLTGVHTELVDTRVVEVVFGITAATDVALYPGQIVDVFINVR